MRLSYCSMVPFIFDEVPRERDAGNDDDAKNDRREIFTNSRYFGAEPVSQKSDADRPAQGPHDVVYDERAVVHRHNARDDGRKGAHDGHEAAKENRAGAVCIIKAFCPFEMAVLEESRIGAQKKPHAELAADPIARVVAEDTGYLDKRDENPRIKKSLTSEEAGGKEHRSARQKESDRYSALKKDCEGFFNPWI